MSSVLLWEFAAQSVLCICGRLWTLRKMRPPWQIYEGVEFVACGQNCPHHLDWTTCAHNPWTDLLLAFSWWISLKYPAVLYHAVIVKLPLSLSLRTASLNRQLLWSFGLMSLILLFSFLLFEIAFLKLVRSKKGWRISFVWYCGFWRGNLSAHF